MCMHMTYLAALSFVGWLRELELRCPTFFVHECTEHVGRLYRMICKRIEKTHIIQHFKLCPSMFGLPATRVRDWIVGTSRTAILDTVNLPTPLRFRRSVTLRGEAFFCAAREFVQEALGRYKAKLGVSSCAVTWREVMSASVQHRVNQADTLRSVGHWMPSGVDNISQTTAFRKGAPIFAGCLTRSNAVHWSATQDRPQLPEECLVQMGLPVSSIWQRLAVTHAHSTMRLLQKACQNLCCGELLATLCTLPCWAPCFLHAGAIWM